jgi:hypothetical protein
LNRRDRHAARLERLPDRLVRHELAPRRSDPSLMRARSLAP